MLLSTSLLAALALALGASGHSMYHSSCKLTPLDRDWPSFDDWQALNSSIGGALLKTVPVASSCYRGNPFRSSLACAAVSAGWNSTDFHAMLPESVAYPIFANNSCLPPGSPGYLANRGCTLGGLPAYVVNATAEWQIASAMRWASARGIRIIIKGTGHDLLGRSSGAHSLSIWTHNFRTLEFGCPASLEWSPFCEDALVAGSGLRWRDVYPAADKAGRAVVGTLDGSVGLGGHIQGGGHSPLSSTYGLAADQVLQATVVTTDGRILRASEREHPALLWAIRGGTGGLYGVVTQFVLRTYPAPQSVTAGTLSVVASSRLGENASWDAAALVVSRIPELMDAGLSGGALTIASGRRAASLDPKAHVPPSGVLLHYDLRAYNTTPEALQARLDPLVAELSNLSASLVVTFPTPVQFPTFLACFTAARQASPAGTADLASSRLLPREALTSPDLRAHLHAAMSPQDAETGAELILITAAGRGAARVPRRMRGALNPAWRTAYVHAIAATAVVDARKAPQAALREASAWLEQHTQRALREWAPRSGAYINEANAFDPRWRENFYGEHYERLVRVKKTYDPSASLWVQGGIGNAEWEYDLDTGKLCRR